MIVSLLEFGSLFGISRVAGSTSSTGGKCMVGNRGKGQTKPVHLFALFIAIT